MRIVKSLTRSSVFVTAVGVLFYGVTPARASLSVVDIFKNISYQQTSPSAPTTPSSYFADVEAFLVNPGDFDSVTVTYPGPDSPASLPLVSPLKFGIGPSFATQADMDAAYPFGTYSFMANNSVTMASETDDLDYTVDAYTSDIPALDAATFTALQGMDPTQPFTFNFNSFTPNPSANQSATFLTIFGSSFGTSLSDTATSAVVPANTLLPGTAYTYELDFSDRIGGTDPGGANTYIGFDVRTDGTFTTAAVPEPSSLIPLAMVFLGAAVVRWRKSAARRVL